MRATPSGRTHESVSTATGLALQITSPRAAGVGDVRVERTAETTWATRCRCAGQRADICAAAAAQKTCALTVVRCLNDLSCPVQRYSVVRPAARGLGWAGFDPDGRLPTAARPPPLSSLGSSRRPTMPRVRPAATGTGARVTQVHDGDASVSVTAEPPSHPITSNPMSRSATLPRLGKLTRAARLQAPWASISMPSNAALTGGSPTPTGAGDGFTMLIYGDTERSDATPKALRNDARVRREDCTRPARSVTHGRAGTCVCPCASDTTDDVRITPAAATSVPKPAPPSPPRATAQGTSRVRA